MAKMSKVMAREVLDMWKSETAYFNGSMTQAQFENMLLYHCKLGQAEAIAISCALVLAGAKFAD